MTSLGFFWTAVATYFIGFSSGLLAGKVIWNLNSRKREVIE